MMKPLLRVLALAVLVVGFLGSRAHADDLADARTFIAAQVELIKKADIAGVKAGLTKRLQGKVTEAQVKKAGEQVGKMTIDDLVAAVAAGKDSLKIKMKNGRTLTTLVKVDGTWLADTIWFK
jgi:cell division FtsZ-interacting protein ZapD